MTGAALVPVWRARLTEGWCPRPDHPRLDVDRPAGQLRGWCGTCGVAWRLSLGGGDVSAIDVLSARIRDAAGRKLSWNVDPWWLDQLLPAPVEAELRRLVDELHRRRERDNA